MKKTAAVAIALLMLFSLAGCKGKTETKTTAKTYDKRVMDDFDYTAANLSAIDDLGRISAKGDVKNGNQVGIFYHLWHGVHESAGETLDLTKILKENRLLGRKFQKIPLLGRAAIRLLFFVRPVGVDASYRTYDAYGYRLSRVRLHQREMLRYAG